MSLHPDAGISGAACGSLRFAAVRVPFTDRKANEQARDAANFHHFKQNH